MGRKHNYHQLLGTRAIMIESLVTKFIVPVLTWMFWIGVAGCVIVMPWCAIKMFAVLFEKDEESS
jgi:hypothetical protein